MRFIVDAQLPPRVAEWLRSMGHEADHVASLFPNRATDRQIVSLAMETSAIIVSKDADFRDLLERLWPSGQLLWIRTGNVLNRILIQRLETEWPRLQRELGSGVAVVELA